MIFIKILMNLFGKIGRLFGKKDAGDKDPNEKRIAIYGPSAVGKTVFFAMLSRQAENDSAFQMTPAEGKTAREIRKNVETLESGEWLAGSIGTTELNFQVHSRRLAGGSKGFPFNTQDYRGETIEEDSEEVERLLEWMAGADAIMFILSPDLIADRGRCGLAVDRFKSVINQVKARTGGTLKAPIGVMISKADLIDGFNSRGQVELFQRKEEHLKAQDFDRMVAGAVNQSHLKDDLVFGREVRKILESLRSLFVFLSTVTLEYQVFFVSSVGRVRDDVDESGRKISRPPSPLMPLGVIEPFRWVIETLRRKEKIEATYGVRRILQMVAVVVFFWYAIPYAIHLLPGWSSIEEQKQSQLSNDAMIFDKAEKYADALGVRLVSGFFGIPTTRAGQTDDVASEVAFSFKAYDAVSGKIKNLGEQDLQNFANSWENIDSPPEDAIREREWRRIPELAQNMVKKAMDVKVSAHNRSVAMDFEERFSQGRCEDLEPIAKRLIKWGFSDSAAEYDQLEPEFQRKIALCATGSEVRNVVLGLGELGDSIESASADRTLTDGIDGFRADAKDILDRLEALEGNSSDVALAIQFAEQLELALSRTAGALRSLEGADKAEWEDARRQFGSALSGLRNFDDEGLYPTDQLQGFIRAKASIARSRIEGNQDQIAVSELTDLFANPARFDELLDRGRMSSALSGHSKRDAALAAHDRIMADAAETGVTVTVIIEEGLSDQLAVVWFDTAKDEWSESNYGVGGRIKTTWYPGKPYKLGVVLANSEERRPRPCFEYVVAVDELVEGTGVPVMEGCTPNSNLTVKFSGGAAKAFFEEQLIESVRRAIQD